MVIGPLAIKFRGQTTVCPYGVYRFNQHNPMQVVGHNHPCVKVNFLTNLFRMQPFFGHHLAKQALALKGADRNEIRPSGGVGVPLEANGATVVFVGVVFHRKGWMPMS